MFKWPWRKKARTITEEAQAGARGVKPFSAFLVKRATGPHAKRGIHTITESIDNVIMMRNSPITPYFVFDFADGTQLAIHHDRLLEVRSHLQEVKGTPAFSKAVSYGAPDEK